MSSNGELPFLPFALPDITEAEVAAVAETLRSGWLTSGPKTAGFEKQFAAFTGSEHALACASATAAMHLALAAVDLQPGDFVIVPAFTFAASAEVVRYFGATPIFADIGSDYCLNRETAQAAVETAEALLPDFERSRIRAVVAVHYGGLSVDLDAIISLCEENGWALVEDAAHGFPTRYKDRWVGKCTASSITQMCCFSFYATKTITTGEGGMLTTNDSEAAELIRKMRLHGLNRATWNRHIGNNDGQKPSWLYDIEVLGYKYNMTDTQAAMGLVQLKRADEMKQRRVDIAARYTEAFQGLDWLTLPPQAPEAGSDHAYYLYPVGVSDRDAAIGGMQAAGIGTSVHFIPLYHHSYYRNLLPYKPEHFPNTEAAFERNFSLPIYSKMADADVDRVVEAVLNLAVKTT